MFQSQTTPAILLAAAAILTAVVGARAAMLKGEASGDWDSAVRVEVKQGAADISDESRAHDEAGVAGDIAEGLLRSVELRNQALLADSFTAQALAFESNTSEQVARTQGTPDERYFGADGSFDLSGRIADLRAQQDIGEPLAPEQLQEQGDELGRRAALMALAAVPAALAILLGSLAQGFTQRRRLLMALGLVSLALGVAVAAYAETGAI